LVCRSVAAQPLDAPKPAEPVAEPAPDVKVPAPEPVAFTWTPYGYLRMQYIAVQDDPNVAFVGRDDGFELQNARVGVRGRTHRTYFHLSFDGAVDERALVNSPQGKLRVGLRDAYVDLDAFGTHTTGPHGENAIVVRGGYFQSWTDPEAQVPDFQREFVDRPIESRGMRATEGWQTPGLPPGRSIGVAFRLDPEEPASGAAFGGELAAQNGADEFASNNDNDALALSIAGLARFPGGFVVAGARWNPRTVGELPLRRDETDYQGSVGAHVDAGPVALGAAAFVQRVYYVSTNGPSEDAYGAHAQLMVKLSPVSVGYRIGVLDPSSLITTDRVIEHTAGAVLAVPSWRMRLQLQLTHVVQQAARALANDRIQLAAEVIL
jgi:hypothetical protein